MATTMNLPMDVMMEEDYGAFKREDYDQHLNGSNHIQQHQHIPQHHQQQQPIIVYGNQRRPSTDMQPVPRLSTMSDSIQPNRIDQQRMSLPDNLQSQQQGLRYSQQSLSHSPYYHQQQPSNQSHSLHTYSRPESSIDEYNNPPSPDASLHNSVHSWISDSQTRTSRDSPAPMIEEFPDSPSVRRQSTASDPYARSIGRKPSSNLNYYPHGRRLHVAPPIQYQSGSGATQSYTRGSYSYPHPNAQEPTPGYPYAFPDPSLTDLSQVNQQASASTSQQSQHHTSSSQLYPHQQAHVFSRSPELRITHKMAERKRRSEMKLLFDELKDHLPVDPNMKTVKWEVLSKAIEYISSLKGTVGELEKENEQLRSDLNHLKQS